MTVLARAERGEVVALTDEGLIPVPGLLSRWVRLASGAKAHYVTSGETGPAVVLVHGGIIGSSGTAGWRFMAPFLGTNGFRVYCPDVPGFGLTIDTEEFYAPDEAGDVDFIHDFTTALCLDRFHLSGNSQGCSTTVNYLVAHPERVISFALIAGGVGDIVDMRELYARDTRPPDKRPNITQFDGTPDSMRQMMTEIILDPSKITDDLINMRTGIALRTQEVYEKRLKKIIARIQGEIDPNYAARMTTKDRLDRITIPGIYLYGTRDELMTHEILGYAQEDALPDIQFFYPEETGHQGQTDQPELFNQVFLEFFRDAKVSWETAQRAGISQRRPPNPSLVAVPQTVKT